MTPGGGGRNTSLAGMAEKQQPPEGGTFQRPGAHRTLANCSWPRAGRQNRGDGMELLPSGAEETPASFTQLGPEEVLLSMASSHLVL